MTDAGALTPPISQRQVPVAMPQVLAADAPLWRRIMALRDSTISLWDDAAFETELIVQRFGKRLLFVANAPDLVSHVLLENASNYVKTRIARSLIEPGLGKGLLTTEGEVWRRQRRAVAPGFALRRINDFTPSMTQHAARFLSGWDRLADGAELDIGAAMSALTLGVISEAMFSIVDDPRVALIGKAVADYQRHVRPSVADLLGLPDWVPRPEHWRAKRIFGEADAVIRDLIEKRRRDGGPDDFLSTLIAASESDDAATENEVRDQVATFVAAGHETTSSALAWTWYLLSQNPAVEAKLHAELDEVLAGQAPSATDIPRLAYTRMVIEESMRLYPPAHTMARMALADDRLRNRYVPAGSTVMVVPWLLHRHRRLWDNPDEFRPERFSPEQTAARPRFAYIPFGAGQRICIGAAFAMNEAVLLLASIAAKWKLRLANDEPIEPVGLITLRPRHPIMMTIARR